MKPKLYDATSFGKNELTSHHQPNQNYLPINYHHFKFRYLNENVHHPPIPTIVDKTMELPIDLSIKRTSPEISSNAQDQSRSPSKDDRIKANGDKINVNKQSESNHHHSKNEAKLLPYLLMSNHRATNLSRIDEVASSQSTGDHHLIDEQSTATSSSFADADLLKYNKKKLFLASIRKRKPSSSTDNSSTSNLSTNGTTSTFSSSSSSSSNSPNSTPLSTHTSSSTHHHHPPLSKHHSDRRNSSSSTTSSTNLTLSPNSDNHSDDLTLDHNPQLIKEFDLRNKLFDSRLYDQPSFNKKFEYFSRHFSESKDPSSKLVENEHSSNGTHSKAASSNSSPKTVNGNSQPTNETTKLINGNSKHSFNHHPHLTHLNGSLSSIMCNNKKQQSNFIGLKRSRSELYLLDQKRENIFNDLLAYKRKLLKRWRSESDLAEFTDLFRCNREERQSMNKTNGQTSKETNRKDSNHPHHKTNVNNKEHTNGQSNKVDQNKQSNGHHFANGGAVDYSERDHKLEEESKSIYENEMKRQFYLRNYAKEEADLLNYSKLMRSNQKNFYASFSSQFAGDHQFGQFEKFNQMKSNSLPLNLQLNRSKASLTFNNSQFLNKKTLISGQCNKLNEKTGKRKFTKLASDEDEEDLEDEEENEENIIVDNSASSSVSPSSIQSNSDSSLVNKQLLVKHHHLDRHIGHLNNHHLDRHHHLEAHNESGGLDLRLPFLNHHSSPHLANHLNSLTNLSRRPVPVKPPSFGTLPTDLLAPNEASNLSNNPKDDRHHLTSWYYLLLNQPDSPAKLSALQWIMKDLHEKNNNRIALSDDWSEQELIKRHTYKQSYSIESGAPMNLTMFNNLNRSNNSAVFDPSSHHRQLLNSTSRSLDRQKFTTNSPQPMNLHANIPVTPDNYLHYVKMNENLINSNRHLSTPNQLQILTGQSYLNLENGNHCLPAGSANSLNSFQDRKRISRPLTGRHVRQGTGASPTTLANLRSMIKERQKFRELNGSAGLNGKKFRKKRK